MSRLVPSLAEAVRSDEAQEGSEIAADEAMTARALHILTRGGQGAYDRALAALHETSQAWWTDELAEKSEDDDGEYEEADERESWEPTAASLRRFLETEVSNWYARTRRRLAAYPAARRQAWAESLDVHRAGQLQAYDTRLDRQLERTLAMLLKLRMIKGEKATYDGG